MEENQEERRDPGAGADAYSKFAYPAGEEPMYHDEHGNLLTPEDFREHVRREETAEDREARYARARET